MKKILQKSWLRSLVLMLMMFVAGSSAFAQDALVATFDLATYNGQDGWVDNSKTVDGFVCDRTGYTDYGINLWMASTQVKVTFPTGTKVSKIVVRGIAPYSSISLTATSGSFEGGKTAWTSSSNATWYNTSNAGNVTFSTSYGNDFYVRYLDVYVEESINCIDFSYTSANGGDKGLYSINSDVLTFSAPVTVKKNLTIDGKNVTSATPDGNNLNVSFAEIDEPGVHTLTVPKGALQIGDDYNNEFSVNYTLTQDPNKLYSTFFFNGAGYPYSREGVNYTMPSGYDFRVGDTFTTNGVTFTFTNCPSGWFNSAQRLYVGQNTAFTIAAPEGYEITKIKFNTDDGQLKLNWVKGLTNVDDKNAVWVGNEENVGFSVLYDSKIQTVNVTCVKLDEITYYVDILKGSGFADDDWTVTVNGVVGTFKNGDSFDSAKDIQTSDVVAPHHDGYHEAEVSIDEMGGDKYISVTYAVFDPITYTVNFTGAPAGAEVTLDGHVLTASDNECQIAKDLDEGDLVVVDPAGYWTETSFDGTSTFTVTYHAYNYYNVSVSGAAGGALVYDEVEYTGGQIESKDALTLGDVEAKNVANYDADVTFDGTTFTVTYTAYPTLAIGANATDAEGNYWTTFSFRHPVSFPDGVTPCIVTDAQDGKLTVQEFEKINNEASVFYDFQNNKVERISNGLYIEGDNHDVSMTISGSTIFQSINPGQGRIEGAGSVTISHPENISRVIVTPWGGGYGANVSLDGADPVNVGTESYTFNVNAPSCTLGLTSNGNGVYIFAIEVIVGSETIPVIPANTGILVKADEAKANIAYTVHEVGEVNTDVSANLLVAGNTTPSYGWDNANKLYYKLAWASSAYDNLGFYWGVDGGHSITPNANKAYLVLDAAAASNFRAFTFDGNGTITAIEGITSEADNAPVYNLQGQRVNAAKAGIYVKNGRKFIVK